MKRSKLFRRLVDMSPDKLVYSLYYFERCRKLINWRNPKGFNAKEQWLKLNYRNPLQSVCADKYRVRDYVRDHVGFEVLNTLYGVYDSPEDIDFDALPDSYVLKINDASGWNIIVPDKTQLDIRLAKIKLGEWMASDFSNLSREWHYKNIPRKIVAERYLDEPGGLKDYKIYCFNGEPKYILVIFGRDGGRISESIYDTQWRIQDYTRHHELNPNPMAEPGRLDDMLEIARKLAADFPLVRVDLYNPGDDVFFGEMTFHPGNGVNPFKPPEIDLIWGNQLEVRRFPTISSSS